MTIFQNSFLSVAGQKERLSNVGATLKAAVTGKGVQAHTSNPTFNKVLGTAASHPFATALAVAAPVSIAKSAPVRSAVVSGAASLAKTIGTQAVTHPIQTSAAVLIGAPLIAGAISKEPKLITELPKRSFNTGRDIIEVVKENPVPSAVIGSVTGGILGYELLNNLWEDETSQNIINDIPENLPSYNPTTIDDSPLVAAPTDSSLATAASAPGAAQTEKVLPGSSTSSGTKRKRRRIKRRCCAPNIGKRSIRLSFTAKHL